MYPIRTTGVFEKKFSSFKEGLESMKRVSVEAFECIQEAEDEDSVVCALMRLVVFDRPSGNDGFDWNCCEIKVSGFGIDFTTVNGTTFGWKVSALDYDARRELADAMVPGKNIWTFFVQDENGEDIVSDSDLRWGAAREGWYEVFSDMEKRLPQTLPAVTADWMHGARPYYSRYNTYNPMAPFDCMYWVKNNHVVAEAFNRGQDENGIYGAFPAVVVFDTPVDLAEGVTSSRQPVKCSFAVLTNEGIQTGGCYHHFGRAEFYPLGDPVWSTIARDAAELLIELLKPETYGFSFQRLVDEETI